MRLLLLQPPALPPSVTTLASAPFLALTALKVLLLNVPAATAVLLVCHTALYVSLFTEKRQERP